ncbi:MAG: FAD binding domain-containing protein [Syntrophorhabdaceae bacterium]|nr:FAD binding domain-containing protein [Syntrophorhabdaceae bacterium]
MRSFAHINARTIDEAIALLRRYRGRAVLNAGSTDLLSTLKGEYLSRYPEVVINLKSVPDLDYIRDDDGLLRIGALARLSDIVRSPLISSNCRVLADAARSVASPQIRNAATIGGNLCQDVRCWYYRYPRHIGGAIQCARKGSGPCLAVKGDNRYHAIMNGKRCFAVCPSDTAVALAVLDACIHVSGPEGDRTIAITDFFGPLTNDLKAYEIVREIEVPKVSVSAVQTFLKFTVREPIDFAIVSVASVITREEGMCTDARIALGAVAPGPVRASKAEEMLKGNRIDEEIAARAAEQALAGARPLSKNVYKIEIARTLVKRAILK